MYKNELVQRIGRQTRIPQQIVSTVLNTSHRLIEEELRKGRRVVFPGFGTFATSKRQGGTVVHVRTKETVEYPGRRVAVFKVGEVLKRAVAGKRRR